jgi:hypothetical protein
MWKSKQYLKTETIWLDENPLLEVSDDQAGQVGHQRETDAQVEAQVTHFHHDEHLQQMF